MGYYTKIRFLISALNYGGDGQLPCSSQQLYCFEIYRIGAEACAPFFQFHRFILLDTVPVVGCSRFKQPTMEQINRTLGTRIRFMKSVSCADLPLVGAVNIDGDMVPSDHAVPHCVSASQQLASATRFEFQHRHVYCHRKGRQTSLVLFTILVPPVATSPHLQSILDPLSSTAACAQPLSQQRDIMATG